MLDLSETCNVSRVTQSYHSMRATSVTILSMFGAGKMSVAGQSLLPHKRVDDKENLLMVSLVKP